VSIQMSVTLTVKCSTGTKFTVTAELSQSVGELKAQLVEQSAIPADQMRLIYRGHVLKDANSLQSYGKINILANLDFGLQFCSFF
jgi:ubiquilin